MTLTVLEQGFLFGIMVLGVFLSFRVLRVPDLTVDGSFPLGGAVAASLIAGGAPPLPATLAALGAGMVAGGCTGLLHARMRMSALLAGILTMTALYSVNLRIMGRPNVPLLRLPTLLDTVAGLGAGRLAALVLFVVAAAAVGAALYWFLRTEMGLALRATGDNEVMAVSAGIEVGWAKTVGLAIANGLVALSGALAAQYQGFADVNMGLGTIVAGLASVILGEALVRPRRLTSALAAAVLGSVVYRGAIAAALELGLDPGDLKLATALLVMVALAIPALTHDPARRRRAVGRPWMLRPLWQAVFGAVRPEGRQARHR